VASAIQELGGNRFRVQAWVDAQNAFGANLRTHFTCTVQCPDSTTCTLEGLELQHPF
jgi:hypothetical protein